jgi:hypothetical protein
MSKHPVALMVKVDQGKREKLRRYQTVEAVPRHRADGPAKGNRERYGHG